MALANAYVFDPFYTIVVLISMNPILLLHSSQRTQLGGNIIVGHCNDCLIIIHVGPFDLCSSLNPVG